MSRRNLVSMLSGLVLSGLGLSGAAAQTDALEGASAWEITLSTPHWGDLTGVFAVDVEGRDIALSPGSTLAEYLPTTATRGNWFQEGEVFSMRVRASGRDRYRGRAAALEGTLDSGYQRVDFRLEDGALSGAIAGNAPFVGALTGRPHPGLETPVRDYQALHGRIDDLLRQHLYDPRIIDDEAHETAYTILAETGRQARDDFDFVMGYAFAQSRMGFSHFQVTRPDGGLEALIAQRSQRGAGGGEVDLSFRNDVAMLTINSFVGERIGEQISDSFVTIQARGPSALIVDLRDNRGGSLAGAVLGNHLISASRPAGVFVTGSWFVDHDTPPTEADIAAAPVWQGASLEEYYAALAATPILRVSVDPAVNVYAGPVYVLLSGNSSSMTEIVAAALSEESNITLIGENTAGQMLSSRFFDAGDGYVVRIPIADYYTASGVRLEGAGVAVDTEVSAGRALERARTLAAQH